MAAENRGSGLVCKQTKAKPKGRCDSEVIGVGLRDSGLGDQEGFPEEGAGQLGPEG